MFSKKLLTWYQVHKRELPWRGEKDPYKIWISEIILQQTRVKQGWEYYLRFMERFPDVFAIVEAGENEVLKYWQGLGYYTRARNIYAGAVYIVEQHKGVFPKSYSEILKIKGVGEYTASAIASIAYKLPYAAIDGNVFRVISRIFGIYDPIDTSAGKNKISEKANNLIDKENPDLFNQAIMDFGAMQCVPLHPNCEDCCFKNDCFANLHFEQTMLPVKIHKTKTRSRYFYYWVIREDGFLYFQKRENNDIWKGLFEFPLEETKTPLSKKEISEHPHVKENQWKINIISPSYKHVLSHQIIYAQFVEISRKNNEISLPKSYIKVSENEIDLFPIHRLIEKYFEHPLQKNNTKRPKP